MTVWFVFNGDADGLCAAHQLRLAGHQPDHIVTGVKRDIGLLERCPALAGDHVWVADISLDANREALKRCLDTGVTVTWFDHHYAGVIPDHPALQAHIDTSALVCSSLLVDRYLGGQFRSWAVAAAFGDNLTEAARQLAGQTDLAQADLDNVAELGTLINYNAYGQTLADLQIDPAVLFGRMQAYADPRALLAADSFVHELRATMRSDLALAHAEPVRLLGAAARAVHLPNAPWARRVQGVFANDLARTMPESAHAILTASPGGFSVSVRAPLARPDGADALCRQFASGGGRRSAAGINLLPIPQLDHFLSAFALAYSD